MVFVQLGGRPLADFAQPLEMLQDCHRRIEHFLRVLTEVAKRFGDQQLDEESRRALETALDYFALAAPRHTADEEQSLFPRMRASEHPEVQAAFAELDRLEADHRAAEVMHQTVDSLGRRWLRDGYIIERDRSLMSNLLAKLSSIYKDHIRHEDTQVFRLASLVLSSDDLGQVGAEMRERRLGPA